MRLTDKVVMEAECPSGKKDVLLFDEAMPGFGLRVSASGSRTFIFQYRQGPAVRRIPLGAWGKELTTAAARKRAEALRGQVRDHRDPVAERRAARAAALEAEAARKAAEALAPTPSTCSSSNGRRTISRSGPPRTGAGCPRISGRRSRRGSPCRPGA